MANRYPLIVDSSSQQIKEFPSGDTLVIDNLQVTGTTTTLETATLNVEDKNITVNYSTGDSSATADGSGLTFQDAVDASNDATILWNATNDEFDFSHGITLPDSQKITFGAGSDLQIYSDGDSAFINEKSSTGSLFIEGDNIRFRTTDTSGTYALFTSGGSARLYHNNSIKFETTSTGIDVTGNAAFDDNGKAIFGADSDLEIYHDGSDSIINEAGTGVLKIRGSAGIYIQKYDGTENLASFLHDDGVYLYDGANNIRLQTTSTGVTVTGALLEDSNRVATNGRAIAFSLIFG